MKSPVLPLLALAAAPALAQEAAQPAATLPAPTLPATVTQPAAGNRAGENAVRGAGDAFGTVIGREEIGLYSADDIRGFSPVAAGNVRIEGLYFDPVGLPSDRISGATTIRVGPSALGSPFPAPTGIVDIGLRLPEGEAAGSALLSADSLGSHAAELDLALPLTDRLSIGVGAALSTQRLIDATREVARDAAIIAQWRPGDDLGLIGFFSLEHTPREDAAPLYVPAGAALPPDPPRRRFIGPAWAAGRSTETTAGAVLDWQWGGGWQLKAGLFRSTLSSPRAFSNLLLDVTPDGRAQQQVVADPPLFFASTSGEARLTRQWDDGPRAHRLHLALRGRQAFRRFGGADSIDLGPTIIGRPSTAARPAFGFGVQEEDRVRQLTLAAGYEGEWTDRGSLSVGVQRSDYHKRIGLPGQKVQVTARPWLMNVNAAVVLGPRTRLYGGYVTGLEESGVAPDNAANRNEALPAIITRQFDLGLRQQLGPLVLVAGGFQLTKPYFNLGPGNRFGRLGDVTNRGIELSLAGPVTERLSLVAGGVFSRPRVSAAAVALGVSGPLPVGPVPQRLSLSADWRPAFAPGLSLDIGLFHDGRQATTVDNRVALPARSFVDVGARYAFRLAGKPAVLRAQIINAGGVNGVFLEDAGVYGPLDGRVAQLYLTVDF